MERDAGRASRATARSGAVVVVGSISVDLDGGGDPLPRPGETVVGTRCTHGPRRQGCQPGGRGGRSGATTTMIGAVGRDTFAGSPWTPCAPTGVDRPLGRRGGRQTGVAHIRVDARTGENDIVIVPEATVPDPGRVEEPSRPRPRPAGGAPAAARPRPEVAVATARSCAELEPPARAGPRPGLPAARGDRRGRVAGPARTRPRRKVPERTRVTDVRSAERAARWFIERGVRQVVATRGGPAAPSWRADAARPTSPRSASPRSTPPAGR